MGCSKLATNRFVAKPYPKKNDFLTSIIKRRLNYTFGPRKFHKISIWSLKIFWSL